MSICTLIETRLINPFRQMCCRRLRGAADFRATAWNSSQRALKITKNKMKYKYKYEPNFYSYNTMCPS